MKKAKAKGIHRDVYFPDPGLLKQVEDEVQRRLNEGVSDISASSLINELIRMGIPRVKKLKTKVKELEFQYDLTNATINKVGKMIRVVIENLQDGERVQVGTSFFTKDEDGNTKKPYGRVVFERVGSELKIKQK